MSATGQGTKGSGQGSAAWKQAYRSGFEALPTWCQRRLGLEDKRRRLVGKQSSESFERKAWRPRNRGGKRLPRTTPPWRRRISCPWRHFGGVAWSATSSTSSSGGIPQRRPRWSSFTPTSSASDRWFMELKRRFRLISMVLPMTFHAFPLDFRGFLLFSWIPRGFPKPQRQEARCPGGA